MSEWQGRRTNAQGYSGEVELESLMTVGEPLGLIRRCNAWNDGRKKISIGSVLLRAAVLKARIDVFRVSRDVLNGNDK